MSLPTLVTDLRTLVSRADHSSEEIERLVRQSVTFPADFRRAEITLLDLSRRDCPPRHQLFVSAHSPRAAADLQPVLESLFYRSQQLKWTKGTSEVQADLLWTPEHFQSEVQFPRFFPAETRVQGWATSIDPSEIALNTLGDYHSISAKLGRRTLSITANGRYHRELEGLIEPLQLQLATLRLSKVDAERLLRRMKNEPLGEYIAVVLEKSLQPQVSVNAAMSKDGLAITLQEEEFFELEVPASELATVRDLISKPLFNVSKGEITVVTKLKKEYPLFFARGKQMADLQYLARVIPEMDLGLVYGRPVITRQQAKELVDTGIAIISRAYEQDFPLFAISQLQQRREALYHLVKDLYVAVPVDQLTWKGGVEDFVSLLQSQGYQPAVVKDDPDLPSTIKERHLLAFFRQCYQRNPEVAIETVRDFYVNTRPELGISSSVNGLDVAQLGKLDLPAHARLASLGIFINSARKPYYGDSIGLLRTPPSSDDFHFGSITSIENPEFLPLQESVLQELGFEFR